MRRAVQRLLYLEPLWVLIAIPLVLTPPRFWPLAMAGLAPALQATGIVLLLAGRPLRWLAHSDSAATRRRLRTDRPLALLLLTLPLAYLVAVDKVMAWNGILNLACGIALYDALVHWPPSHQDVRVPAYLLLAVGAGLALIAPLVVDLASGSLFAFPGVTPLLTRLAALTPGTANANLLAGVLAVTLPPALVMALFAPPAGGRALPVVAAAAMVGAIVLSQSRAGLVLVALIVWGVLAGRWRRLWWAAPIGAVVVAALLLFLPDAPSLLLDSNSFGGWEGRLEIWQRALYALQDFPITGIGFGQFTVVIPTLYPYFILASAEPPDHAHNLALQVALDVGLIGLFAYGWLLWESGRGLWQRRMAAVGAHGRTAAQWVAYGMLLSLATMLLHGLIDAPLWGTRPAFVAWIVLAGGVVGGSAD